jgi:AraC-like DNA-binding protein
MGGMHRQSVGEWVRYWQSPDRPLEAMQAHFHHHAYHRHSHETSAPAEVATEAGFADQAHPTRWFVRSFGITPGTYRRAAAPG